MLDGKECDDFNKIKKVEWITGMGVLINIDIFKKIGMFDEKKLGQKSGEGYYKYSDDKYERVALSEELAQKCNPIQLVANILNNAAWLVSNGASDIEEIEKAAQLGLGLKKPLFETAKEIGIKNIVEELNKLAAEHGEFYKPDPLLVSMQ